jgi:hypothetical protein
MSMLLKIANTTDENLKDLREYIRSFLIRLGEKAGNEGFIRWAEGLSDNALAMCTHLGFDEAAFIDFVFNKKITVVTGRYDVHLEDPEAH